MHLKTIAIYSTKHTPTSMLIYTNHVSNYLIDHGIKCIFFSENDIVPKDVDIIWDPRAVIPFKGLYCTQYKFLKKTSIPIVITSHGANMTYLPLSYFAKSLSAYPRLIKNKYFLYYRWKTFKNYRCIITVSNYAKSVLVKNLSIKPEKIIPIYLGTNIPIINLEKTHKTRDKYFLHVSNNMKIKNVSRIIKAFEFLDLKNNEKLILVLPGYKGDLKNRNIEIISSTLTHEQLASLYFNAIALLFPSIAETFGLPIIEAMMCSCPVITSNHLDVFKEIGGDAALYVDPFSYKKIAFTMAKLYNDILLRKKLIKLGQKRAAYFSWEKCGYKHLELFEEVINSSKILIKKDNTAKNLNNITH